MFPQCEDQSQWWARITAELQGSGGTLDYLGTYLLSENLGVSSLLAETTKPKVQIEHSWELAASIWSVMGTQ